MSQKNFIPEGGSSNSIVQQNQEEIGIGRLPTNIQIAATAGHHTTFVPPHSSIRTGYTIHQQQQLIGNRTQQTINPTLIAAQQPIVTNQQARPIIQQQQPQIQPNTAVKNKVEYLDNKLINFFKFSVCKLTMHCENFSINN